MTTNAFPALDGRPVTEAHADKCARDGHATHKVDGVDTGVCPRCGEVTEQTQCPGSLKPPARQIPGSFGRHLCSACESVRFPRKDGTFPNHRPTGKRDTVYLGR